MFAAVTIGAQNRVAIVTRDLSPEAGQESVGSLITLRLQLELEGRGYDLIELEDTGDIRGTTSDPRVTLLDFGDLSADTDLVVIAFYRVEGDAIVIQFVLVDPVVDIVVGGILTRQRTGINISTSVVGAIEDLRPSLVRWESDRSLLRTGPPPDTVERLVVFGPQEDVRVRFAELEIGQIRGGQIVVPYSPFPVGSVVPMTLSRPGYHEREVSVELNEPFVQTDIPPLFPASRVGLSVLWTSSYVAGAGLGLRFYPTPDVVYVSGEFYHFLNPGPEIGPATVGRDVRVTDARVSGGLYFFAPEAPFRPFVELGGGMIITDVDAGAGGRLADDPVYRDVFVGLGAGLEANLGRWKPFGRADFDYALGLSTNNLLSRRWVAPPVTERLIPIPMVTVGVQHTW